MHVLTIGNIPMGMLKSYVKSSEVGLGMILLILMRVY